MSAKIATHQIEILLLYNTTNVPFSCDAQSHAGALAFVGQIFEGDGDEHEARLACRLHVGGEGLLHALPAADEDLAGERRVTLIQ